MARVNRLIQTALAELIPTVKDPRVSRPAVLAVAGVSTTPDLRFAKVFLSVSGTDEERGAALAGLQHARGFVRSELGRSVRLRHLPELNFVLDESIDSAARVEQILRELASEKPQP